MNCNSIKLLKLLHVEFIFLFSIVMRCFDRLVMVHINLIIPDPLQICLPPQQIHRRCNLNCTPLSPLERPSQAFRDAPLRVSYQAVSPPGTTRLSKRVVWSVQCITGGTLPALQDTYSNQCLRKAKKIIKDINHPSHGLFTPLSSRRRGQYRRIKTGTARLKNSFSLKYIRLLNSHN
jgi:hypothetical protein